MKLFYVLLFLFILLGCSFDKKTGIWKNENQLDKKSQNFKEFKTIKEDKNRFNEEIELKKNFSFFISKKINNTSWEDIFYNQFNNYDNFSYNEEKNLIFKGKKISKYKLNKRFLYDDGNLILADNRGNLIIFSIKKNKIISKFNFYKKKYRKIIKSLNLVIKENVIYVSDNLGFIYAIDYKNDKILWAKDNKVPFRSNLKIENNKLITTDQNNIIYFFNKNDGNVLKLIPTEETKIKNDFKNNFELNNSSIFMLNTYGSLYSINKKGNNVEWMVNLNQSLDVNTSNLFNGHQLTSNENYIIVSSQDSTYVINSTNGEIKSKFNIISKIKPLIVNNNLFLISSNNLFICINLKNSEILYSFKVNKKIAEFLEIKEKFAVFDDIILANNKILVLLKSGYLVKFDLMGNLEEIFKLPTKINSNLVFINNSILYLDNKNKLVILG